MQFSSPARSSICRSDATGKLSVTRRRTANELLQCSHQDNSTTRAPSFFTSCFQRFATMLTQIFYGNNKNTNYYDNEEIKNIEVTYSTRYEDYLLVHELGAGGSAVVFAATYRPKQALIAVKRIDLNRSRTSDKEKTALRREIHILSRCMHPHVMSVLQTFSSSTHMYIIMPMMIGSCRDLLTDFCPDGLNESLVACILKQAVSGLLYLHHSMIIHRDIKAANILLDQSGIVKLADFGASNYYHQQQSKSLQVPTSDNSDLSCRSFIGTPCWMAPEVIQGHHYNEKVDLWALGITAIELTSGSPPNCDATPPDVFTRVIHNPPPTLLDGNTSASFSANFHAFVERCLQKDPVQRLSSDQAGCHPFIHAALPTHHLAVWLRSLKYPPSSSSPPVTFTPFAEAAASTPISYPHFDKSLLWTEDMGDDESVPTTPDDAHPSHLHDRDILLYTPKEFHLF